MTLTIGTAARQSGVKVPTIRYYEQIGLLPDAPRSGSNRRLFAPGDVRRLIFIRHARELGFDLNAIRALLSLHDHPDQSCASADSIASARLAEVQGKIAGLQALAAELERMLAGCAHGRVETCRVIETLADHSLCHFHGTAPAA